DVGCTASNAHFASANASASPQNVTATVALTGTTTSKYTLGTNTTATTTATISPKPVTAAITAADKTYDGNDAATINSCTIPGKVGSDDVGCTASNAHFASANASASPQNVTATVGLTGAAASNYTLGANTTAATTAKINPATASVTGINSSPLGVSDGTVTISYKKNGLLFAGTPTDAASYTGSASFVSSNGNYNNANSTVDASLTISQADATITVNGYSNV